MIHDGETVCRHGRRPFECPHCRPRRKERPILFSGPMVRAILEGRKTQTRRPVKGVYHVGCSGSEGDPSSWGFEDQYGDYHVLPGPTQDLAHYVIGCPYGQPGDVLWVRETWHCCPHCDATVAYRAGGWMCTLDGENNVDDERPLSPKCAAHGWRPSIHMPRRFSRLTLLVKSVRVERVREISDKDARAEGHPSRGLGQEIDGDASIDWFSDLWDSTYAKRGLGWESNPFVWRVEFEPIDPARGSE